MDLQTSEFMVHLKTANKEMLEVISIANATIAKNSFLIERIDKKLHL